MMYVSIVASVLVLVVTARFYIGAHRSEVGKVKARLSEARITSIWAPFLMAAAVLLWYGKLANPAMGGSDAASWVFVAVLALLCVAAACFSFLMAFVKTTYATNKELVSVSPWGKGTRIAWADVTSVQPIMLSRSFHVNASNGRRITVSGDPKGYPDFIAFMLKHVNGDESRETLNGLRERFARSRA